MARNSLNRDDIRFGLNLLFLILGHFQLIQSLDWKYQILHLIMMSKVQVIALEIICQVNID